MFRILQKSKYQLKKVAIFSGLFLGALWLVFFLVNMDIRKFSRESEQEKMIAQLNARDEIRKRLGSAEIGTLDFSEWSVLQGLFGDDIYDADPDGDGLSNYLEFVHLTDPRNPDTDSDGYSDSREVINGYDPDAPGEAQPLLEFSIKKIGVEAPMVWSKSENEEDMLRDLENGLSHFPKTASPGQNGNAVISGHSSNYVWAKGEYKHIFKNLNDLEKGDLITVKASQKNGRMILYRYKVGEKYVTTPDDERIFADSKVPTLTLSTCWPLGTTLKRVIIKAEMIR